MDEYIELEYNPCTVCEYKKCDNCLLHHLAAKVIKLQATNVAPVVHGRWVYDHWCEFKCSECGHFSESKPYKGREPYCSNCGAKMDLN